MNRHLLTALRITLPLVVIAIAGMIAITMINAKPPVETQSPEILPPLIRTQRVTLEDLALTVTSQGTVSPRTESQLISEVSGRVMWVSPSFASGGFFENGTKLLEVDPYDYERGVIRAEADLARTKLRLAEEEAEAVVALKEWSQLGDGSANALTLREPQLADAKAAVAAAKSNLETSRRNLERTEIRAPYSGRVRQKHVDVGQFVTTGSVVASIYSVDYAEIRLPLTSDDLAYVDLPLDYRGSRGNREGPLVTLKTKFAGEEHVWTGRITRTEGEIDPKSRMVHAVAQVRNPYARGNNAGRPPLAVGMYVEAEIAGKTVRDVAILPRVALRGDNQILVVDSENHIRFRTVTLLRKTDTTIIVDAGLTENETICLSLLEAVSDGMRVRTTDTGDIS